MEQFSQPSQNDELLNQPVTDDELREILDRIGQQEFNGNPLPTVRDIAEGTSADPATIGRILGDIRKEDWEKRFGLELKDHARRILTIEAKQNPPPVAARQIPQGPIIPPVLSESTISPSAYRPQHGYGSKRKSGTTTSAVIALIVFAVFAVLVFGAFFTISSTQSQVISGPMPTVHFNDNSNLSPEVKRAVEESVRNGNLK